MQLTINSYQLSAQYLVPLLVIGLVGLVYFCLAILLVKKAQAYRRFGLKVALLERSYVRRMQQRDPSYVHEHSLFEKLPKTYHAINMFSGFSPKMIDFFTREEIDLLMGNESGNVNYYSL